VQVPARAWSWCAFVGKRLNGRIATELIGTNIQRLCSECEFSGRRCGCHGFPWSSPTNRFGDFMTVTSTPPAPPQLSPDGQWWWNGAEWVASNANTDLTHVGGPVREGAASGSPAVRRDSGTGGSTSVLHRKFPKAVVAALALVAVLLVGLCVKAVKDGNRADSRSACREMALLQNTDPAAC